MILDIEGSKIAIQSKGRLTQDSLSWLNNKTGSNFPVSESPFDERREIIDKLTGIAVLGFANRDLLAANASGLVDFTIVGLDKVAEQELTPGSQIPRPVAWLGAGLCRLVIATREEVPLEAASTIVTSYPNLTKFYMRDKFGIDPEIVIYSGSSEMITRQGGYDGVVDITETGTSLERNGLVERDTLLYSGAKIVFAITQENPGWIVTGDDSGVMESPGFIPLDERFTRL